MPHSFGYRAATRTLFKKAFKTNGRCHTTTYLRNFKVCAVCWLKSLFVHRCSTNCCCLRTVTFAFNLNFVSLFANSVETMLISRSTPPSTRVCPSSTTTAEPELCST